MYNSNWYYSLTKPPYMPPNWVFSPAWLVLYLMIIVSLIIYIKKYYPNKKSGYIYFSVQMVLNLIWSPIFFGLKEIFSALVVILALDVFVLLTMKSFYKVSKVSAILLIPYIMWILFATYLNIWLWVLN